MSMPGFITDRSSGLLWVNASTDSPQAPDRDASVVPAAPCCSACFAWCGKYPNHYWCKACRPICSPSC